MTLLPCFYDQVADSAQVPADLPLGMMDGEAQRLFLSLTDGGRTWPAWFDGYRATNVASCSAWLAGESDREPDHVCHDVAEASTAWFVVERMAPTGKAIRDYSLTWPLPIGTKSILAWVLDYGKAHRHPPDAVPQPVIQLEQAYLGLAARQVTAEGSVWLLGLVEPVPDQPDWWSFNEPRLVYDAAPNRASHLDSLNAEGKVLLKWYRAMILGKRSGGRPPGVGTFANREECRRTFISAMKGLRRQGRLVTQDEVGEYLLVHTDAGIGHADPGRQIRRWLKEVYHLDWDEMLREASLD